MKWDGQRLLIGQPDYARKIVSRHPDLPLKYSPLRKLIELEPEEIIDPDLVRQCQTVVGELLWLSTRTTPGPQFCCCLFGSKSPRTWPWSTVCARSSWINSRWAGWTR